MDPKRYENKPDLRSAKVVEEELITETRFNQEREDQFAKRAGKFTASPAHRLMAGVGASEEDKQNQLANNSNKTELIVLAEKYGETTEGTKADLARRIVGHLPKYELSTGAYTYIEEKIIEHKTGLPIETYQSYAMQRGHEMEEPTVKKFMEITGMEVVGWGPDQEFIEPKAGPLKGHVGCTPDGKIILPKIKGGFEGKAPTEKVHYRYLHGSLDGKVPPLTFATMKQLVPEYYWQVLEGMLVTGWDGWHFASYHPDFPEHEQLLTFVIERDWVHEDIGHMNEMLQLAIKTKLNEIYKTNE